MMKLGPHIIIPTDAALQWASKAPIVKALDNPAPLHQAPDQSIRVYRQYFAAQDLHINPSTVVSSILNRLQGYRHPLLYVELYNEIYQRLSQGLPDYLDWTERAVEALHAQGIKVAGFSFSTGCPEPEDWRYIQARQFAHVDAIAIHEYWGDAGFSGWNALRYRRAHDWLSGNHPPFIITECGRDAVEGGKGGWIRDGISSNQYLTELANYDAELQRDAYVLGATVFTAGPTRDWQNFGIDDLADRLVAITVLESSTTSAPKRDTPMTDDPRWDYLTWANACRQAIEAGQPSDDPRDPIAFKRWLDALGKGSANLHDHGLPYVEVVPK